MLKKYFSKKNKDDDDGEFENQHVGQDDNSNTPKIDIELPEKVKFSSSWCIDDEISILFQFIYLFL